jgi:ABC-2 type transport system ATP-binding protein
VSTPVIRCEGVTKRFGATEALHGVDLVVEQGEVFGYLGPNGAGKTTTLRILMGLTRATTGRVELFGLDAWRHRDELHRRVGYVPGDVSLYPRLTGQDHVDYLGHLHGLGRPADAAELAKLLELDLAKPTRQLSRGNRQKLALVLALMTRPELLVLDEPSSGLDPLVQREFHALLADHVAQGGSVLLSSHVLSEVQRVATRIGVLSAGRVVAVEELDALRAKSLHHVEAQFDGEVQAAAFSTVTGVRDVRLEDGMLRCDAPQASLDPLLKRIARYPVVDLSCTEAELEETFMAYYAAPSEGGSDAA